MVIKLYYLFEVHSFIGNSPINKIDLDWIDPVIHESKRANNIEFTGSVKGTFTNGSNFVISSLDGQIGDISICVFTNSRRWIIQEGSAQKIIYLSKENNFNENKSRIWI